jgi:hypothetical protein
MSATSIEAKYELVLVALRCARVRFQLMALECDEVGLALKYKMVSPEVAVGWLDEIGALQYVNPEIAAMPAKEAA